MRLMHCTRISVAVGLLLCSTILIAATKAELAKEAFKLFASCRDGYPDSYFTTLGGPIQTIELVEVDEQPAFFWLKFVTSRGNEQVSMFVPVDGVTAREEGSLRLYIECKEPLCLKRHKYSTENKKAGSYKKLGEDKVDTWTISCSTTNFTQRLERAVNALGGKKE
jgi:hypothetical protein